MITTLDKLETLEKGIVLDVKAIINNYYTESSYRNFLDTYFALDKIDDTLYHFESANLCLNLNNFIKHLRSYINYNRYRRSMICSHYE